MDKNRFWQVIDSARQEAGHWKDMRVPLQEVLFKLDARDILRWQRILEEYMDHSFKKKLWAAAEVITGGACYEKQFENFQRWLIVQGEDAFMKALENPGSLARIKAVQELGRKANAAKAAPPPGGHRVNAFFEDLEHVACNAYENKPGAGDYYDALDDYGLSTREQAEITREIIFAKDIDIEPGGPNLPWLESQIASRQAFPELYALFNDVTAVSVQNYDIIHNFRIGGGEVLFMENQKATDTPYLVCNRSSNNPLNLEEFTDAIGGKDYLEMTRAFVDRVSERVKALEQERAGRGVPAETLTAADCVPDGLKDNLEGKVAVLKPEKLAREYRTADYQLVLVTGGFGVSPNASGRKVFCTELYSGNKETFNRDSIAGVILPEQIPEWAREKLASLRKPAERESVLGKIRVGNKEFPPPVADRPKRKKDEQAR